ncbi:MAG: glycosyltransferase [Candidatus Microsaccharimonas sp.]
MHIVIFLDQHPDTLGGAQLSAVLQARFLEKSGHVVTLCGPASSQHKNRKGIITFTSFSLGTTEYAITIPSNQIQQTLDATFKKLPAVDIVHIQADFWGAIIGFEFAKRHEIPAVITYHNNVEVGTSLVTGKVFAHLYLSLMARWAKKRLAITFPSGRIDGWKYLAGLGKLATARIAPTAHFARDLEAHGVGAPVNVLSNGLDDEVISSIKHKKTTRTRPLIVWTGRFSKEKRIMEFLQAVRTKEINADIEIYGSGSLKKVMHRFLQKHSLNNVKIVGSVSSTEMLRVIASADLVVQTSIGFETQGRTVFEALSLGTPVLLSDPKIAEDFTPDSYWLVKDRSVEALVKTLQQAVSDIQTGHTKKIDPTIQKSFLQSHLTKKIETIYHSLSKATKHTLYSKKQSHNQNL